MSLLSTMVLARLLLLAGDPDILAGGSAAVSAEAKRTVELEVRSTLSALCPRQCELADVKVRVAPKKSPVGATPGFEELSAESKEFEVSSVEINVMIDTRLTGDFRAGLKEVIERRLAGQGIKARVRENLIKMPLSQELPQPPQAMPQMPQMPQMPRPAPEPEPRRAAPQPEPVKAEPVERGPRALDRVLDALPLLLGLLLCGGIVAYTLRQYARILERTQGGAGQQAELKALPEKQADPKVEELRVDRELGLLAARLEESPALRRELFVSWLREAEPDELATAFSVLGPGVFAEVRSDAECAEGLEAVADYIAETEPDLTVAAKLRLAATLRRRLLHVQIRRGGGGVADAVAKLASVDARAFAAALALEDEEVQVGLLREAPTRLQQAVFATRSTSEQARLVRLLVAPSNCSVERLLGAAERISSQVGAQHVSSGQVAAASGLLESVESAQRRRILESLQTSDETAYRGLLADLVTEETLTGLGKDVIGAACLRVGVGPLALAIASLPAAIGRHVANSLTAQQARAVKEEAEALGGSRSDAAVRQLLVEVRREARAQGVDLYAINHRVLGELVRGGGAVA